MLFHYLGELVGLYAEDEGMESGLKVWVQQSDNLTE
jgi:hypothetical protein